MGKVERQQRAHAGQKHVNHNQRSPFERTKHRIQDHEDDHDGDGSYDSKTSVGTLFALILSGPVRAISIRQLHLIMDLLDSFFHGATEISASYAVLDSYIARFPFTIDLFSPVGGLHLRQLS